MSSDFSRAVTTNRGTLFTNSNTPSNLAIQHTSPAMHSNQSIVNPQLTPDHQTISPPQVPASISHAPYSSLGTSAHTGMNYALSPTSTNLATHPTYSVAPSSMTAPPLYTNQDAYASYEASHLNPTRSPSTYRYETTPMDFSSTRHFSQVRHFKYETMPTHFPAQQSYQPMHLKYETSPMDFSISNKNQVSRPNYETTNMDFTTSYVNRGAQYSFEMETGDKTTNTIKQEVSHNVQAKPQSDTTSITQVTLASGTIPDNMAIDFTNKMDASNQFTPTRIESQTCKATFGDQIVSTTPSSLVISTDPATSPTIDANEPSKLKLSIKQETTPASQVTYSADTESSSTKCETQYDRPAFTSTDRFIHSDMPPLQPTDQVMQSTNGEATHFHNETHHANQVTKPAKRATYSVKLDNSLNHQVTDSVKMDTSPTHRITDYIKMDTRPIPHYVKKEPSVVNQVTDCLTTDTSPTHQVAYSVKRDQSLPNQLTCVKQERTSPDQVEQFQVTRPDIQKASLKSPPIHYAKQTPSPTSQVTHSLKRKRTPAKHVMHSTERKISDEKEVTYSDKQERPSTDPVTHAVEHELSPTDEVTHFVKLNTSSASDTAHSDKQKRTHAKQAKYSAKQKYTSAKEAEQSVIQGASPNKRVKNSTQHERSPDNEAKRVGKGCMSPNSQVIYSTKRITSPSDQVTGSHNEEFHRSNQVSSLIKQEQPSLDHDIQSTRIDEYIGSIHSTPTNEYTYMKECITSNKDTPINQFTPTNQTLIQEALTNKASIAELAFAQLAQLSTRTKKIKMPYKCDYCSQAFERKKHQKLHLLTHTEHNSTNAVANSCKRKSTKGKQAAERNLNAGKQLTHSAKRKAPHNNHMTNRATPPPTDQAVITVSKLTDSPNEETCLIAEEHSPDEELPPTSQMGASDEDTHDNESTPNEEFALSDDFTGITTATQNLIQQALTNKASIAELALAQLGQLSTRTKKNKIPFQCEFCYKTFERKNHHTMHLRIHTGEKPFSCELCGKAFANRHHLTPHMRIHTGEKPHQCPVCEMAFSQRGNLLRHSMLHTGEKPHTCEACNKSFAEKSSLRRHYAVHTGEKNYACEICSRHFADKGNLARHVRGHTMFAKTDNQSNTMQIDFGERLHTCELCGMAFTEKSNLNKHLQLHTGEKPHTCELCDKSFAEKCSLQRHMSVHTGDTASLHTCNVCGESFLYKNNLDIHMQIHTVSFEDVPDLEV